MLVKRIFTIIYKFFVYAFAIAGFVLIAGFFAVKYHVTDLIGIVDQHSKDYQQLTTNLNTSKQADVSLDQNPNESLATINELIAGLQKLHDQKTKILCDISNIGTLYPINGAAIFKQYQLTHNDAQAQKMIFAATLQTKDNQQTIPDECDTQTVSEDSVNKELAEAKGKNLYPWINDEEWTTISAAITKDKDAILKASQVANIDPRLVVSSLTVEQLRLFHSQRELFEKFFKPLSILGNATKTSLGVMGIKEATAKQIEDHLKDPKSPYYLGPTHEHDLDFSTKDINGERFARLTDEHDHYYSYLYGALYIKQMMSQWLNAGFSIENRPEITTTLFNVGFAQSKPNDQPKVGGSTITIKDKKYSFGALGFEFYFSGELSLEFPLISE